MICCKASEDIFVFYTNGCSRLRHLSLYTLQHNQFHLYSVCYRIQNTLVL